MNPPEIFDRNTRRLKRDRAVAGFAAHAFLLDHIAESLLDRLDLVSRSFSHVLNLGCFDGRLGDALARRDITVVNADAGFGFARAAGGIQCDEDRLPFADESFDLVVSGSVLDQVNDLPGALSLIRRILKPDGLFLAGFVGAGSLPKLRSATMAADMAAGSAVGSRLHPQIDVRAAGDLLGRAGFTLPVADGERLTVRYADPLRILSDLRGMAATNTMKQRAMPLSRARLRALVESFAAETDGDGRLTEIFELIFMTGWAPGPDQPKPARRGSGKQSLTDVLHPPR
jgi:SAM-dependent methyltransferase